jgi:hypothetical protein
MITLLQTTNLLADCLWWVVLITFCFAVYHWYRLAALPWILAHFVVALITVPVSQALFAGMLPPSATPTFLHPFAGPIQLPLVCAWSIGALADLVVLVLALSEVARLLTQGLPGPNPLFIRLLLRAHFRVRALGLTAVLLAAAGPVPALIYRSLHGAPTA